MFNVDSILKGPFWPEPVRVISSRLIDDNLIKLDAVGIDTQKFYSQVINDDDFSKISIEEENDLKFDGDAEKFFLFVESRRIRNAFQFDPLYAVNVSQVDPLPHQIDAVYYHALKNPRLRFLIADDPGAGKTIMAGLIIKELKYRGLIKKILIVAPGHLKYQWLREMKEKFHEHFKIADRDMMDSSWGQNIFDEEDHLITSIDFVKQDDVISSIKESHWDLIIVDEAHKMSAYKYGEKITKTRRYLFGETASEISDYLLFLTATPHRGDDENFRLFLDLLEPGFFADTAMLAESIQAKDNPLFIRRLKEDMKNFNGEPIFPPRTVTTMQFNLSDEEKELYNAVTSYVQVHFNKALAKEKRNVVFAMIILQRRLASSVRAVRKSLIRRRNRLQDLYDQSEKIIDSDISVSKYLDDLAENERWKQEEELLLRLTSAESREELKVEIDMLDNLTALAKEVEDKQVETKLLELQSVINQQDIKKNKKKLLIFTEARDTLEYLIEKIKSWGFTTTQIHGLMKMNDRIDAEKEFQNTAQILIATEAAGEGINLQFCSLMVNYDIPWNPNRLEQRMGRIHRYGQQEEVFIYNLVAKDTREGSILIRLFEKMESMKDKLGSERVFDVIGEIWGGEKSLADLIMEAVTNQRSMDEILKDFDSVLDEDAVERLKAVTMESLSTKHIDLHRILGERRKAKENRLVPEFVEAFFHRASKAWDIGLVKRNADYYRITSVPFDIRNRGTGFRNRFGPILNKYNKISFDKEKAFKGKAEFVAMGHPLLEAVVESNFDYFSENVRKGSIFLDPDGNMDGIIWVLAGEIKDGNNIPAGKRLFCIYQDKDDQLQLVNPGIFWDLKPMEVGGKAPALPGTDRDKIISYVIKETMNDYKNEILEQRKRDSAIKEKYGIRSLNSLIAKSEAKLAGYATKKMIGENVVAATEQREQKKKDSLVKQRTKLENQIKAETHLLPGEPQLIGAARVIPDESQISKEMRSSKEIEEVGMKVTMKYEKSNNRNPIDVSKENLGYDIKSENEDEHRYIEVKARASDGNILLTNNEWLMAQRLKDEFWLYVVTQASTDNPKLHLIQYPAEKLDPKIIESVRYNVTDWKDVAE